MRRKATTLLAGLLVLALMAAAAGCGGSEPAENNSDKAPQGGDQNVSLAELGDKFASIPGMYYELEMNVEEFDQTMLTKCWMKKGNMRMEMDAPDGSGTITHIVNAAKNEAYMVMGDQMATRMDISQVTEGMTTPEDALGEFDDTDSKLVGTEKVDGKECLVYEVADAGEAVKVWVWKEYGFPLKAEITAEGGKAVVEYKNVKVEDIPDSMFELPAGVEVMDMNMPDLQNMPGMENMPQIPGMNN